VSISDKLRDKIRVQAGNRCGYCLTPQHLVYGPLEIDHIIPSILDGTDDESNLWLACRMCNSYKGIKTHAIDPLTGERVPLFNPRMQNWNEHLSWTADGSHIAGISPVGRATITALQMNTIVAVGMRRRWVDVGWHPPR